MSPLRYFLGFASVWLPGCNWNAEFRDPEAEASISAEALNAGASPGALDDAELRRSYAAKDIKLAPCARLMKDDTIAAEGCANGIVTFGPYFSAPAGSDVVLRFDITPSAPLLVASDMVSGGKLFHAALDPVAVAPGAARSVGYKVHFFDAATGIEARIGTHAEKPAAFQISNVRITVQ
jgi:hypothetical protein